MKRWQQGIPVTARHRIGAVTALKRPAGDELMPMAIQERGFAMRPPGLWMRII